MLARIRNKNTNMKKEKKRVNEIKIKVKPGENQVEKRLGESVQKCENKSIIKCAMNEKIKTI
jgi:hypothetical protein